MFWLDANALCSDMWARNRVQTSLYNCVLVRVCECARLCARIFCVSIGNTYTHDNSSYTIIRPERISSFIFSILIHMLSLMSSNGNGS